MTTDLSIDAKNIIVSPGYITFKEFKDLKIQAKQLAAEVSSVEVNDETIKASKKLLAAVNNKVKELESRRIEIKKEILEPYNLFESQIKEIVSIVKDADNIVRSQVRQLEEVEREEKKETINELWKKRLKQYGNLGSLFPFESFLTNKHLNKSTTMKSIESEMVDWLEKKENDLLVINTLPNAQKVLTEYLDTKDVATAIRIVNEYEERLKKVEEIPPEIKSEETFTFSVQSGKDAKFVELLLKQNNIDYKVVK